jgi:hypothetical protein
MLIRFLEAEAPRPVDSRREEMVRLSALRIRHVDPLPQEYSWYSFLLEAESIPGQQ